MTLAPGTRIGSYEILGPLGSGGMGEVYRARDTRLDRTVAIKALPQAVARDPERLARFEREAKLLASLNHPNIGGIHGLEESSGSPYLVLEFIEGETLAERLKRGALPPREALQVVCQIACAIEAAHERGVVHRDLKPANVMLTPSRFVKVLDFGLAKGGAADAKTFRQSPESATAAMAATAEGTIIGTTAYMSPEQARGKAVDRRTDVWAFGCVLFECLTGIQAYAGETPSDVIAKILDREPDWSAIPSHAPPRLRDLLRRCLTKNPQDRPRDIGDLRRELTAIASESPAAASSSGTVPSAPAPMPSLAVLYFDNLSSDPESDYFCAGITEDILTDLSKIRGIRVASRNAVARFRGAPADISKVACELGVGTVLEGSVRRAGDRVRISAQLINAADGFHLWAERYDRTLQDVFAVQEEIASSIAAALRITLTPIESEKLGRDRPNDVRAYDLYLKGREYYGHYTRDSLRYALELFQEAAAVDPSYALAFAGMADCYGQMIQWGITDEPEEVGRLGLEAARRAIALNPRLPEGYKAEALILLSSGDRQGARAASRRAIDADSRFTPALINLGTDAFYRADLAGAERLLRRVIEIDSHRAFAILWLGFILFVTDRHEEGCAARDRLRRVTSEVFYVTHAASLQASIHLRRGDLPAAERDVREAYADGAEPSNLRAIEAMIAARSGHLEEAKRLTADLESSTGLGGGGLVLAAGAALRAGETKRAVSFMTRRIVRDTGQISVRLDPELHPLLDHEPFAPRRMDATLVWPLEAPALDPVRRELFREVRVESGLPRGSDAGG